MRVYLTGFMGAGKTTVGRLLAAEFDCSFVDLDRAIEAAAGRSVKAIFDAAGESGFRRLEADALRRTADFAHCVVATGGGTPLAAANRRWMRQHGVMVWLAADFESLSRRVGTGGERPLWGDTGRARTLFYSRLEDYGDCDHEIDTAALTPADVVRRIVARLEAAGLR